VAKIWLKYAAYGLITEYNKVVVLKEICGL
jgi:hypothetical protein